MGRYERPYRSVVETGLPPLLIFGMYNRMIGLGYPQTPGIMHSFATAARDAVESVPVVERDIAKALIKEACVDLLRDLRPDDHRDMLLACLSFWPILAENGLLGELTDPLPQLCLQEIRDFARLGQWRINDRWVTDIAQLMLMRARLIGYYLG